MQLVNSSRQIGYLTRQRRSEMRLTQKQLAKQAGVSERLVIALELGDATGIRVDKLLQVLSTLDLSLAVVRASGDNESDNAKKTESCVRYASLELPDLEYDLPPELTFSSLKERK